MYCGNLKRDNYFQLDDDLYTGKSFDEALQGAPDVTIFVPQSHGVDPYR